jgi:hypothetical protein
VAPAPPVLLGLAVAPPVLVPCAAPDSFADPAVLGETPLVLVPVPELPPDPVDVDPPAGWLLGAWLGGELVGDDALCPAEADVFGEEGLAVFGFAVWVALVHCVEDDLGLAWREALAAAEAGVAVAVAVPVALAVAAAVPVSPLLPADTSGLALAVGLPLSVDGLSEGLVGGVVDGVSEGLADTELPGLGVPDVFGLADGQDAAGFGLLGAAPGAVAPGPRSLTGPPPEGAGVAWLLELWPVTDALSVPIAWRSGGIASTTAMTNRAQARPSAGRSRPSRQSPVRRVPFPRRPRPEDPEAPKEAGNPESSRVKERRLAWARLAEPCPTRARIRSSPSGRGSTWSAAACSSRRRNSAKSCPALPSRP